MRPTARLAPPAAVLAVLLACDDTPPVDTSDTCDYSGPEWVCRSEGDILVYRMNSCGEETGETERCLNSDVCVTPDVGDAYCGNASGCIPDDTTEVVCDPNNPDAIIEVDSCGEKVRQVETCLGDATCVDDADGPHCAIIDECAPDDGTYDVGCDPNNPDAIISIDECGEKVSQIETCLGDSQCLDDGAGPYCGCPMPEEPILGCNPEGGSDGPAETTLSYLNECGELTDEVAVTCAIGERCWYTWNEDGSIDESAGAHCAASMDPSQSDSPFYAMACDFDMYMHATTGLWMDCRCHRSNPDMQECRPGADAWTAGLRIGTGPHIHGINFAKWGGGFIHNGELYAAVHYTGGEVGLKPGAIYAIDIVTGDRRVISGAYESDTGRVNVGGGYTPEGEALPFLTDIALGADGMIYAFGSDTLLHVEITRVDPATGDRTLVWRRKQLSEGMSATFPYGQCYDGRVHNDYLGGYQPVQYADRAFALGTDGSFYVGWNNDGVGVVNISADGATCTHVSRWASRNNTAPLPNIGGGVTPQYGTISGLLHRSGKVYAFTENILLAIDDSTGDRAIFSNAGGIGGLGETNFFVDDTRDIFFACGTDAPRKCSVHKMSDGNVAQGLFQISQSQPVIPGKYPQMQGAKGALDNDNYTGNGAVAIDPNDNNILYFIVLAGVIKYEIDTGNSYFMSM